MPDETTSNPEPVNAPVPELLGIVVESAPIETDTTQPAEMPAEQSTPTPEPAMAQLGGNEPFAPAVPTTEVPTITPNPLPVENVVSEVTQPLSTEPAIEAVSIQTVSEPPPATTAPPVATPAPTQTLTKSIRELFAKAQSEIQFRKRKKLDRVMNLFAKQTRITNDEIEKLLHVSDATATRYLSALEKEGKIKQSGKTGKGVSYSKI